jgi:hypothetical protein
VISVKKNVKMEVSSLTGTAAPKAGETTQINIQRWALKDIKIVSV